MAHHSSFNTRGEIWYPDTEITVPRSNYRYEPLRGYGSIMAVYDEKADKYVGWIKAETLGFPGAHGVKNWMAKHNRHVGGGRKTESIPAHVAYRDLTDGARELFLFADNTGELYPLFRDVQANQEKHLAKSRWNREKAIVGWMHFVEASAKQYAKEFGGTWHAMFSMHDRKLMAAYMADMFHAGERK